MSSYNISKMSTPELRKKIKIKPSYINPNNFSKYFATFIASIEELLEDILNLSSDVSDKGDKTFIDLIHKLPIIKYSNLDAPPCCFSFWILTHGKYTQGIGRFMADMLCKWLIPGKQLSLNGNRSLNFSFENYEKNTFFFTEYFILINDEKDLFQIKKNIDKFIKDLKLNISSVYHARHIISLKKLSFEEKSALIQENISTLLNKKPQKLEQNAFDEMQHFLFKLSAEKNLTQIRENLNSLMLKRPNTFDRDIYESINYISSAFKDRFTAQRDPKYVAKLIGYSYLLNKIIKQKTYSMPSRRHIAVKLLKTKMQSKKSINTSIGIILTMNIMHDTERFEQKHFLKAIKSCVPNCKYVSESFLADRRETNILSFYLEITRDRDKESDKFSFQELKNLKKNLSSEIKEGIENILNPIFMPRNEEEVLRNIVLLSKQLKYVRDIPQLIISYDKQTGKEISFVVIMVRLIKSNSTAIIEKFATTKSILKYQAEETKIIGMLKNKYPKEVNLFKVSLNKTHFFRKDFSLDLQKARQIVVSELVKVIGDFRDFNGGMIHKQSEILDELKKVLIPEKNSSNTEFAIEKFFYSIKPAIMQSILDINTLTSFYSLFTTIRYKIVNKKNIIKKIFSPKYIIVMIATRSKETKSKIESTIISSKIPTIDLSSCSTKENETYIFGYIYRTNIEKNQNDFFTSIKSCI